MRKLFIPLTLRKVEFRNRIFVSPMCQYSCKDGMTNDWHLVHLGSRAVGGAALVLSEATAVAPEGRISPCDTGIWNDEQAEAFKRITAFGRKASTLSPWQGGHPIAISDGGWQTVAPSPIPFQDDYPTPLELSLADIEDLVKHFVRAAKRALAAGFRVA